MHIIVSCRLFNSFFHLLTLHHHLFHFIPPKVHETHGHNQSHHKKNQYFPLKVQNVSKLPQSLSHGLTVQELKEMTKARLATEATDETASASASISATATGSEDHQYPHPNPNNNNNNNSNNPNSDPRQRVYSYEGTRQRFDSADSFRSAPSTSAQSSSNFRNPFAKSRSSTRLHQHAAISTFGSMDGGDNASVTSYASGIGTESFVGSEASGFYNSTCSSRDLVRSGSFPHGETRHETEHELYGQYMTSTSTSFETSRRHISSGLPSPGLSNLMEDKPFHSDLGASFSGEGNRFDFGGLPVSPAVHRSAFGEEALSDFLPNTHSHSHSHSSSSNQHRPITPSNMQSHTFSDPIPLPIPELKNMGVLERQTSRGGELSKNVAESVLGSPQFNASDSFSKDLVQDATHPWDESNDGGFSKLQTDLNNLLLSENNNNVDSFPFSSFQSKSTSTAAAAGVKKESDWSSLAAGDALVSHGTPNSKVTTPECFDDDGGVTFSNSVSTDENTPEPSPAKSVTKKRTSSRWKFM